MCQSVNPTEDIGCYRQILSGGNGGPCPMIDDRCPVAPRFLGAYQAWMAKKLDKYSTWSSREKVTKSGRCPALGGWIPTGCPCGSFHKRSSPVTSTEASVRPS